MDQERSLKELKSVLRSLVVSSPAQVDVRSLLRDYRSMVGSAVPLAKYGHRDPLQFLKEYCSDCFVFQGPPSNPTLTLIVPETLKHIDQFVQRQKVSSTVKFKGKRRSIPEPVMHQPDLIANTFIPRQVEIKERVMRTSLETNTNKGPVDTIRNNVLKPADIIRHTNHKPIDINTTTNCKPIEASRDTNHKSVEINKQTPIETNSHNESDKAKKTSINRTYSNLDIHDHNTKVDKENNRANANNQTDHDNNHQTNAVLNFLKKRMPLYTSAHPLESEMSYDCKTSSKEDDDSGRQTSSSSSSSTKAALLEELKVEIRDLIADYPEGMWCTDLISLYRARYNRELNFSRFGYTSIISLLCMLEDVVRMSPVPDSGNWLLTDARAQAAAVRPRRYLCAALPRATAPAVDVDDALPGIDFDPDVFPEDCVHFMESIPTAPMRDLEKGAMLDVVVGEVYSPSHFWLLRLGQQFNIAMENMMDDMTRYYTYGEGKDWSLALGAVRVGHYCTSLFERDWHRALIVKIVDSDTVKVRHVDYGTVETVRVSLLKPLRREWAALPAQALRARLAAVRPPAAGRRWPHASSTHFLACVRDTRLVANIAAIDKEEDILEVFLVETSSKEDICINTAMIRSGHADARSDSALRTPECYLFPRFDVLEVGDTPNFGEIQAYLRDGITLEYVEEYRRHVPACLPPEPPAPPTPPLSGDSPPPSAASDAASAAGDDASAAGDDASAAGDDPPDEGLDSSDDQDAPAAETPDTPDRAVSSPDEPSPPHLPSPPVRSKSPHPRPDAAPEFVNRTPLRGHHAAPARLLPPVRTPVPHAYSQMLPLPGYGGFPPFPGAVPVPLYPPMYPPPPPPMLLPHGPFCPAPYPPMPMAPVRPPAPYSPAPEPVRAAPPAKPSPPSPPPPEKVPSEGEPSDGRAPVGEVTLSVSECEIFKLLSRVDANAAHWYMVDAISRAMRTSVTAAARPAGGLNPEAAEFRHAAGAQPDAARTPNRAALPPGMRPPPGFGD